MLKTNINYNNFERFEKNNLYNNFRNLKRKCFIFHEGLNEGLEPFGRAQGRNDPSHLRLVKIKNIH
ncbi:hypothetical protein BpHYR1_020827 [Brachionus plicatilis]|uniref:Uncharacterized protein n=1 Tax=Brachionus plicatilis TaxID=10195 RepID=A0A3M7PJK4_BRAPC|nr:hypothetical protein BpHYR1_020827 [Brachionus plicatilis]